MLKKLIPIFLLSAFIVSPLLADFVTQSQARQVADNLIIERQPATESFQISDAIEYNDRGETPFYIFKMFPQGFVLIAAEDAVLPILGYSFESQLVDDNIPQQLEFLLRGYSEEIQQVREIQMMPDRQTESRWSHYTATDFTPEPITRDVAPMLNANWGQGNGWNQYCPGQTLVGCVAVSMGQVMYHWEFPTTGAGYNIYFHPDWGQLEVYFYDADYNYNSMYNSTPSSEAAELLYHCGVAVEMDYGYSGSGAQVGGDYQPNAFTAMRDNFMFDNESLFHEWRNEMSDAEWIDLILEEMDSHRPIIYAGHDESDQAGHAWNLDGYQGSNPPYFHCNWGWDGYANGYFTVNNLAASGYNFDVWHQVIAGIQPGNLSSPNLQISNTEWLESTGDGDGIINPGEVIDLTITFENQIPWGDAMTLDLVITSSDADLTLGVDFLGFAEFIPSGGSFTLPDPVQIIISEDAALGSHMLEIMAIAIGGDGMSMFEDTFQIEFTVSLDQLGFPLAELGQVSSAPLAHDLDNDGSQEIIFAGFNNGLVYALTSEGLSLPGFPVYLGDVRIESAPALADLDGDGDMEIVISAYSSSPTQGHIYIVEYPALIISEVTTDLAGHKLYGTPALGNLDSDNALEIVVGSFANEGLVAVFNADGTAVSGFPVILNEKITSGVALADVNGNGRMDILTGTLDQNLYLIGDDGVIQPGFPYTAGNDFRSAPAILERDGDFLLLGGNRDGSMYGINPDGSLAFQVPTENDIFSTPAFCELDSGVGIFFGSDDDRLYGIDVNGSLLPGFPVDVNAATMFAPVVADLDNDGSAEIIIPTNDWKIHIHRQDGSPYPGSPINSVTALTSSPLLLDLDGDDDVEIVIGTSAGITAFDIKQSGTAEGFWNMYRGDLLRSGCYQMGADNTIPGDANGDTIVDVLDIITIVSAIMSGETNQLLDSADMNNDGILDILDIITIVNIIMN